MPTDTNPAGVGPSTPEYEPGFSPGVEYEPNATPDEMPDQTTNPADDPAPDTGRPQDDGGEIVRNDDGIMPGFVIPPPD